MILRILTVCLLCFYWVTALGQTSEVLSSDRPGQTYSANTVGQYVLQLQAGGGYLQNNFPKLALRDENNSIGGYGVFQTTWSGIADLRFGLLENFELLGSFSAISYKEELGTNILDVPYEMEYDGSIGLRYNIYNGSKFQAGAMLQHSLSTTAVTARAMGSWNIYSIHNLSANVFYTTNYEQDFSPSNLGYTLNYALAFNGWGTFIESFGTQITYPGIAQNTTFLNYFDAGAWYLLSNNLQLDATLGFGNNSELMGQAEAKSTTLFAELGLTWRFFAN